MIAVLAEAVCPAIVHFAAFDGDMASRRLCREGRSDGGGGNSEGWRANGERRSLNGSVGAVKAGIASGEAPEAFLVAELKLGLEQGHGPFRNRAQTKFLCSGREETCFLIMARVSVMIVMSTIGTLPKVATRWMLAILAHKSSMGSSKFQGSDKAARLFSSSSGVRVPYSRRR